MVDRHQTPRDVSAPEPCWLRIRLERHGPYLPARIFNRLGLLTAEIEGVEAPVESVWTAGDLITEAEYNNLIRDRNRQPPF